MRRAVTARFASVFLLWFGAPMCGAHTPTVQVWLVCCRTRGRVMCVLRWGAVRGGHFWSLRLEVLCCVHVAMCVHVRVRVFRLWLWCGCGVNPWGVQEVAERVGRMGARRGFAPRVLAMDAYNIADLPGEVR